ncbi:glycoside hydrolase family 10 protein [Olivibacter sitiensis]|uniref:glycoside hydrolase family 10 protein n=1 Tax=Olivibacter sitiensis TaxID=376470 RepID=UPI001FE0ADB9|nr:family 10 glycosylhydrolase [Olivibacter sitiensis]
MEYSIHKQAKTIFLVLMAIFLWSGKLLAQRALVPKRELRGVWVATVVNIDWPSKDGLSVAQQKEELLRILDAHQRAGINAVFFQVRPSADAFYAKSDEPWSRFLNGKPGKAPSPAYDPLEFIIKETHLRGMELHAWFNPYRATMTLSDEHVTSNHITKRRPEWFFSYGAKKLFNPGIPAVRDYIVDIIMNVVKNYDIDGVHFDDYFYPYPDKGQAIPDAATFRQYGNGFSKIDEWRRDNVNLLIHTLNDQIHIEKPYLKFGVSPFGIWQNKNQHPDGSESSGLSGYSQLYADAKAWLDNHWVDYITPQVYFTFDNKAAPYEKLVDWWANVANGRHVYIGHAAYRAGDKTVGWRDRSQLPNQIRYLRTNPSINGSVYFSSKSLVNNLGGFRDSLQYDFYRFKALPPKMPWLDSIAPNAPVHFECTALSSGDISLKWDEPLPAADGERAYGYVVYRFNEGEDVNLGRSQSILEIIYDSKRTYFTDVSVRRNSRYIYIITALDRVKNESLPSRPQIVIAQ